MAHYTNALKVVAGWAFLCSSYPWQITGCCEELPWDFGRSRQCSAIGRALAGPASKLPLLQMITSQYVPVSATGEFCWASLASFPLHASAFPWEYSGWRRLVKSFFPPSCSSLVTVTKMIHIRHKIDKLRLCSYKVAHGVVWKCKRVEFLNANTYRTNSMEQSPYEDSIFSSWHFPFRCIVKYATNCRTIPT
jgi:hypothetical protein